MVEKTTSQSWWKWFWATIITLLLIYMASYYIASQNTNIDTKEGRKNYLLKMREIVKKNAPQYEKYIANMSKLSKEKIKEKIDEEIEIAYSPVYSKGIDNFTNFHYSVKGEYIELFDSVADSSRNYLKMDKKDNFDKLVYEMLFKSTDFDSHLKEAYNNINNSTLKEITQNIDNLHQKIQDDLNATDEESNLLIEQMFQIGVSDMKERFRSKVGNSIRATGIGGGAIAGALVSKQVAKVFTKKLAVKGGSKVAGSIAGIAAGGETGLLCGPAAVLCSPVGAVIGGVVGWFATDAAVATVDEYFNADDFKDELKSIIKSQETQTKEQFYRIYTQIIDETDIEDKAKLEEFKHKQNGNNL